MLSYLIDENMNPEYRRQLQRRAPEVTVWRIGDPGTPPTGTLDPEILKWCEAENMVLVTENRSSMPVHLKEQLEAGRHVPGILVVGPSMMMGQVLDELHLIAIAVEPRELRDQLTFLPIT